MALAALAMATALWAATGAVFEPSEALPGLRWAGLGVLVTLGLGAYGLAGQVLGAFDVRELRDRLQGRVLIEYGLLGQDLLAVVVDADSGIEYGTRRMMDYAKARGLCRVIVVNKIDHGGDLAGLMESLRENFGPEVLPLNLPADGGANVIDCFGNRDGTSDLGPVADWHQRIIDQVVEVGGPGTLDQSIRAARIGGHIALIGVLTGRAGEVPTALLMAKQVRLQGLIVGSHRHQREMIRAIETNGMRPVIDRAFALEEIVDAFRHQESGAHFGKIVLEA